MWQKILLALVNEFEKNPDRVAGILEEIITLIKTNPAAMSAVIDIARARLIPPTTIVSK